MANQFLLVYLAAPNPSIAVNVGEQHGKEHYGED
jgi:hypothetical protein